MFFGRALVFALPIQCFGGGLLDKRKAVFAVIALFLLVLVLGLSGNLPYFAVYQTPVFCNGYGWISCVAKDATVSPITQHQQGATIWNPSPPVPSCANYQCRITGWGGSQGTSINPVVLVVGTQKYRLNYLPVTVASGQSFYFATDYGSFVAQEEGDYYYVPINEMLLWTGIAGSTVGLPVLGADGCTFNSGQQGRILALFDQSGTEIDDTKIYTVPNGFAYKYVDSEQRHVCGYSEEECSADSQCIGHTLTWKIAGDSECSAGTLNRYGCRQYSDQKQCITWDSDDKTKCLEYKNLSRCEPVETKPVQCCPYTDSCGQGTCDPATFTCQQAPQVECTYDWECGQATYCDRSAKQLQAKKCVASKCVLQNIQSVQCCYDLDCPLNYYCNSNYACQASVQPKSECPAACCVSAEDLKIYYEKLPPSGQVCCPDRTLAVSLDKCMPHPELCGNSICDLGEETTCPKDCGASLEEECLSRQGDGIFVLRYSWVEPTLISPGRCDTVFNWPLVILAVVGIAGAIGVVYIWKKK